MAPLWMPLTHEIKRGVAVNSPAVEKLWLFNTHHNRVCLKPIKTKRLFSGWNSTQSQQDIATNYQ